MSERQRLGLVLMLFAILIANALPRTPYPTTCFVSMVAAFVSGGVMFGPSEEEPK